MKNKVELYIGGEKADVGSDFKCPFSYTYELLENPVAIKNSHSFDVVLNGTRRNNTIFDNIFKADRVAGIQTEEDIEENEELFTGHWFNPKKRTPFEIYVNGEITESGYLQLTDVTKTKNKLQYHITMYSGLGNFFYNLAYNDEYTPKQMKDLWFKVDGDDGYLPKDDELDFKVECENVSENLRNTGNLWSEDYIDAGSNRFDDVISFVPCQNGTYDNFDNNKILVNTMQYPYFPLSARGDGSDSGTTYETYNGYLMIDAQRDFNEWELGMLRSYMQRPALRLKRFFKACFDPDNNGGYEVVTKGDFFNDKNDLWNKSFIMFPLLNSNVETTSSERKEDTLDSLGFVSGTTIGTADYAASRKGSVKVSLDAQFAVSVTKGSYGDEIYTSSPFYVYKIQDGDSSGSIPVYPITVTIPDVSKPYVQLVAKDGSGRTVATSKKYVFVTSIDNYQYETNDNEVLTKGKYVKGDDGLFHFKMNGSETFRIEVEFVSPSDNVSFEVVAGIDGDGHLFNSNTGVQYNRDNHTKFELDANALTDVTGTAVLSQNAISLTSGKTIKKKDILRSSYTPLDFMVGYSKMFGLVWTCDERKKTVTVMDRNEWFKEAETVDVSRRVMRDKAVKVTPSVFQNKFFLFKGRDYQSYYNDKYKADYKVDYGQYRMDTGWKFNADSKDVFEDTPYQNIISGRDFNIFNANVQALFVSDYITVPSPMLEGCKVKYYKPNDKDKTLDVESSVWSPVAKLTPLWTVAGYSGMMKPLLASSEGKLSEIENALILYNGMVEMVDADGNDINIKITDDVPEMLELNNNKMCHLWTYSIYNEDESLIAVNISRLPQFSRYTIVGDTIASGFDFHYPNEIYSPNINVRENMGIYDRYWKEILEDQSDINGGKLMECYLNTKGLSMGVNALRRFYIIDGALWVMNKEDYDIVNPDVAKVQFLRVKERESYTEGLTPYLGTTVRRIKINV